MKYTLKNKEIELSEEEVKEIIKQNTTPVEEKKVGIAINSRYGGIKFQSTKTIFKEAVIEGKSNLSGADLSGAELNCAKFYGRGGTKPLKRSQLPSFLGALGFIIEE